MWQWLLVFFYYVMMTKTVVLGNLSMFCTPQLSMVILELTIEKFRKIRSNFVNRVIVK